MKVPLVVALNVRGRVLAAYIIGIDEEYRGGLYA